VRKEFKKIIDNLDKLSNREVAEGLRKLKPITEDEIEYTSKQTLNRERVLKLFRYVERRRAREVKKRMKKKEKFLYKPGTVTILPGCVFQTEKPAIIGVDVLAGKIKTGCELVKQDGTEVGQIKQIQDDGQVVSEARAGMRVAISIDEPVVGKDINENDVLLVKVPKP